jgi:hypothetical protein
MTAGACPRELGRWAGLWARSSEGEPERRQLSTGEMSGKGKARGKPGVVNKGLMARRIRGLLEGALRLILR